MPPCSSAIMLQGTCSNAGKSLLTAALCRIFTRQGLRVAPFKAQNMALNSFVTEDGEEIGRAQALQAMAAYMSPDVRMNPVLLKPNSDTGSQVIVMGHAIGHMRVAEYFTYKQHAWKAVTSAYTSLASEVDVMVLEGAGSPAEINLKAHDIVNMRMAAFAGAKVLLTADIDRGGAFAALAGTLLLLDDAEKARIAGLILNKFRGDASLLTPALQDITARTGKPFLGVVPWLEGLRLPEEDSVSFKLSVKKTPHPSLHKNHMLDVVMIDLPHISNFTDVDALCCEPDVQLRIVRHVEDIGTPDILILPGSKNTIADLRWLKAAGLATEVCRLAHSATCMVFGICGGLQMLGMMVRDPLGVECKGVEDGLHLLPLVTELGGKKKLTRVEATYCAWHMPVNGYEIHHGQTYCPPSASHIRPAVVDLTGAVLGWARDDIAVWGSYLHGIFDADAFRRRILDEVRCKRGLAPIIQITEFSVDAELDRLADAVEQALDMPAIYRMIKK